MYLKVCDIYLYGYPHNIYKFSFVPGCNICSLRIHKSGIHVPWFYILHFCSFFLLLSNCLTWTQDVLWSSLLRSASLSLLRIPCIPSKFPDRSRIPSPWAPRRGSSALQPSQVWVCWRRCPFHNYSLCPISMPSYALHNFPGVSASKHANTFFHRSDSRRNNLSFLLWENHLSKCRFDVLCLEVETNIDTNTRRLNITDESCDSKDSTG